MAQNNDCLKDLEIHVSKMLLKGTAVTAADLLDKYGVDPKTAKNLLARFESGKLTPAIPTIRVVLHPVVEDYCDDELSVEVPDLTPQSIVRDSKMRTFGAKTWFQLERNKLVEYLKTALIEELGIHLPDELCKNITMMAILVPGFYQYWGITFQPKSTAGSWTETETTVNLWLDERGHISGNRCEKGNEWKLVEGAWSVQGELTLDFQTMDESESITGYSWYDDMKGTWTKDGGISGQFLWQVVDVQSFYLDHHFEPVSSFLETYHTSRPISAQSTPRTPVNPTLRRAHSRESFLIQWIGSERKPQFEVSENPSKYGSFLSIPILSTPLSPLCATTCGSSDDGMVDDLSLLSVNANHLVEKRHDAHRGMFVEAANFIPKNHPARILVQDVIPLYDSCMMDIGLKFLENRIVEMYDLEDLIVGHIGEGTWDIYGRCFCDAKYHDKYVQFVGCSDGETIIGELTVSMEQIQNNRGKVIKPGKFEQFAVCVPVPLP